MIRWVAPVVCLLLACSPAAEVPGRLNISLVESEGVLPLFPALGFEPRECEGCVEVEVTLAGGDRVQMRIEPEPNLSFELAGFDRVTLFEFRHPDEKTRSIWEAWATPSDAIREELIAFQTEFGNEYVAVAVDDQITDISPVGRSFFGVRLAAFETRTELEEFAATLPLASEWHIESPEDFEKRKRTFREDPPGEKAPVVVGPPP